MQSNVPKVSENTKKRWNEEVAQKMQRKLERSSRRDDWAERLEAAAREGGLKEAAQLYGRGSSPHGEKAEKKEKKRSKHKDKEKSRKKKKRKHESSESEEVKGRKSSKKRKESKSPDSPRKSPVVRGPAGPSGSNGNYVPDASPSSAVLSDC